LAYAAGFIDGDGSIFVQAPDDILVCATNTHRVAVEPFEASFGGNIGPPRTNPKRPHHAPVYVWVKSIDKYAEFLQRLEPHLLLKQRQAKLAIELVQRKTVDVRQKFLGWRYGSIGMSRSEKEARSRIAEQISWLNDQPCTCPHSGIPSLEYMAGFFDAEGCVGVYQYKANSYRIQVNVSNRCEWICGQFCRIFAGVVGQGHMTWQWQAKYRVAQKFLLAITPHLVLKKERALNALSLYGLVGVNNGWGVRQTGVEQVLEIKRKADDYNRKGIRPN
jgi:hypothetical protein